MIQFRCWYCNKAHAREEARVGERFACTCKNTLRVPRRSGGNCRVKTLTDRVIEALVYGGGGGLLGCGLGVLIASLTVRAFRTPLLSWAPIAGLTLVGFLIGLFGGERGINWIGRRIRDVEGR